MIGYKAIENIVVYWCVVFILYDVDMFRRCEVLLLVWYSGYWYICLL